MEPDLNVTPTEPFLPHPHPIRLQILAADNLSEWVETFGWDMLVDNREEVQDLPIVLMKLEIVGLSIKKRKKCLGKKEKREDFGSEVGFRVYDLEKIEEDGEEEDEEEGQICLKKYCKGHVAIQI